MDDQRQDRSWLESGEPASATGKSGWDWGSGQRCAGQHRRIAFVGSFRTTAKVNQRDCIIVIVVLSLVWISICLSLICRVDYFIRPSSVLSLNNDGGRSVCYITIRRNNFCLWVVVALVPVMS
jgi:hypothetical protein